jgi:hypothetical protein
MADTQPLDLLQPKPKSTAEYNAETIAASPNSAQILENLQRRAQQLSSPWNQFQSGLDEMVARTAYRPETGIAMLGEKRAKEAQELQSIGMLTAQADILKQQLGAMRSGFQQTGSQPQAGGQTQAGGQPQAGGQSEVSAARGQNSGYTYNGVPLSVYDYQNLKNYADTNDLAGFKAAFKSLSDIYARAGAEFKGMDVVDAVVSGYDTSGQYRNFSSKITKEDLKNWQDRQIVPPQFRGVLREPNIQSTQKKAMGGSIRYMVDGGQPENVPMAPAPIEQAAPRGSMAEDIIGLLTGSGSAQAAPPTAQVPQGKVTVSAPPVDYSFNPEFAGRGQQSGLQQEQQTNEAQLKSMQEERTAAGKFIADISNQSFGPTTSQQAQEIIDMATEHPEYFGYGYKKDPVGFWMKLTGRTEDTQGEAGQRETGMLTGMKEFFSGEDAMSKRARLDNLAKQLGIAYEKEQFGGTGSKMGAQLTTISQAAKGLSSKYPPEQNIAQALTVQIVHERNRELAKEWDKYKQTPGLKNPDPYAFMNTPKVQGIINRWDLELSNKISKVMNKPKDGTKDTDKNGNPIVWKDGKPMRVKQ